MRGWVLRTDIEEEFKWLKDRYVISMKPVWVWHEAAVPGHAFLVVMGLMLLRYLQWCRWRRQTPHFRRRILPHFYLKPHVHFPPLRS